MWRGSRVATVSGCRDDLPRCPPPRSSGSASSRRRSSRTSDRRRRTGRPGTHIRAAVRRCDTPSRSPACRPSRAASASSSCSSQRIRSSCPGDLLHQRTSPNGTDPVPSRASSSLRRASGRPCVPTRFSNTAPRPSTSASCLGGEKAEHVVERPILEHQHDDVIDLEQVLKRGVIRHLRDTSRPDRCRHLAAHRQKPLAHANPSMLTGFSQPEVSLAAVEART